MKFYQQDLPVPSLKQFSIWTPDPTLVFRHQYPIPYHLMLIFNLQVVKWLRTGIIVLTPPDSPWNSPLTIVPKKDADGNITQWCVCINPHLLNKLLLDLTYPIPTIHSITSKVQAFSSPLPLTLSSLTCNAPLLLKTASKTTFTWNSSHYMFITTIFCIKIVDELSNSSNDNIHEVLEVL